ncbi:MAG: hypothetical protein JW904_05435 [Spirochaetales bacterium]|nr:hypothetical protein [Spirochaetales bacterium]
MINHQIVDLRSLEMAKEIVKKIEADPQKKVFNKRLQSALTGKTCMELRQDRNRSVFCMKMTG